jgi:ribose transport system permease protein
MSNAKIMSNTNAQQMKGNINFRQFTLLAVLIVIIVAFSMLSESFFTVNNGYNVLRQVSITGIAAVAMTMIIILGGIDLSVGSVLAFLSVIAADIYIFMAQHFGNGAAAFLITLLAVLVCGALLGFLSGFVTAKGRIPAFITTLALMSILRGAGYIITGGVPVPIMDKSFRVFGSGHAASVPIPVIIMIVVFLAGIFVLRMTRFGRYIYAIGGNEQSTKWSGVNIVKVKIMVYTCAGLLYGLAAIIMAGRLGGGYPAAASGAEMDSIAAVILGGASLSGGKGNIQGTIIGVFIIGILNNGLTLLDVSSYWQQAIVGSIIITAVLIDLRTKKES